MSCIICSEMFINVRKQYRDKKCIFCNVSFCSPCIERFLTEYGEFDPTCPACLKKWTYDFVLSITSATFNKKYSDYRTNIIITKEHNLFQYTQQYTTMLLRERHHKNALALLLIDKKNIEKALLDKKNEILELEKNFLTTPIIPSHIYKCPFTTCKGFLGVDFVCTMCSTESCNKCFTTKETGHICDIELMATIQIINDESKPCPSCNTLITKIDGCDQMWCTQCRTTFSWITQKIEVGHIHNPHYYEWQRRTALSEYNVDIHTFPSRSTLLRFISQQIHPDSLQIEKIHREILNSQQRINKYKIEPYTKNTYLPIRVTYMLNEIDDITFHKKIIKQEKHRAKQQSIYAIYTILVNESILLFNNLINIPDKINTFIADYDVLRNTVNKYLYTIYKRFNCRIYPFNPVFELEKKSFKCLHKC